MTGYRAQRKKLRSKGFLGRSFLISIILNIIFILVFNNLISFELINIPELENIIIVTMVETAFLENPLR